MNSKLLFLLTLACVRLYAMDRVQWGADSLIKKDPTESVMRWHDVTADGQTLYVSESLADQLGRQGSTDLKSFLVGTARARDQKEDEKYTWRLKLGTTGIRGGLKTIGVTAVGAITGVVFIDPDYLEMLGLCAIVIIGTQALAVITSTGFYVNGRRGEGACERKAIDSVCAQYTTDKVRTVLSQFDSIRDRDSWRHDIVREALEKKISSPTETTSLLVNE